MTLYYPPTQNALQKTLGATLSKAETTSATLSNTTGVQNKAGVCVIDRVDSNGTVKSSSYWEWISFTGTSGATITGLTRGLGGSSDQEHATGAIVEFVPDITWAQGVISALANSHTSAGAVDTTKVVDLTTAQTLTNKTLTSPVLNAFTGTGGTITVANEGNTVGLTVTQNDITNNPNGITITNAGTGNGLYIDQNGNGYGINIDSEATTKSAINIDSAINNDGAPFTIKDAVGANAYFQIGRNDDVTDKIVLRLGQYYLWVDATGDLRIQNANPSSDTGGTVVGTQA